MLTGKEFRIALILIVLPVVVWAISDYFSHVTARDDQYVGSGRAKTATKTNSRTFNRLPTSS
ncbi:MAG: hypothetical protein V7638_5180 [Acidobacteriota bacterium]|jgi:hypothetical protein